MKNRLFGAIVSLIALAFMVGMALPAFTMAESSQKSMFETSTFKKAAEQTDAATHSSADCTLTIKYYEGVWYEDPDVEVDDDSRVLLGEHVVTGLHEGDVIDAWDYVVDIPGHVFFDGWPATLTISSDPSQNELTLIYAKLWESEFTVNYYMMVGADLTADNWTDALAPETVEFIKLGSETFENQRYDSLVKGDAYEYKLDGMYVIDTYPAQIRLDLNPDNNVLNVLYTPDSVNLPDDMEIRDFSTLPDDYEIVEVPEIGGAADGSDSDESDNGDSSDGAASDGSQGSGSPGGSASDGSQGSGSSGSSASDGSQGSGSSEGSLPEDTTMSKDELIALLPDSVLVPTGDDSSSDEAPSEVADDFLGNDIGEGELVVTDEMLSNPQDKEEATALKQAYQTGVRQASEAAKMGDILRVTPYICVALAAIIIFMVCAFLLRKRKDRN